MSKKRVCVLGHFGNGLELLNGQTVKTKIVTEELCLKFGENEILKIDTHGGAKTLIKAPLQVIKALKTSKNVVIFPAHNGLRVYAPMLSFFKKFFSGTKLHYAVIGGWLPEFIEKRKSLSKHLQKFDGIYVETKTMKKALEEQGFDNISIVPNCKRLNILREDELIYDNRPPFHLCTFSRVMKEKGIEDAINAVKAVNEKRGQAVYTLDIYGQIDSNQTEWFEKLKSEFPDYISYKGCVDPTKSVEVLKEYFALLFPTYYQGEGFAGTVIDAFSAGVPVVASDWKYNAEIVSDGKNGFIFETHNVQKLADILQKAIENPDIFNSLKTNCLYCAHRYEPEKALEALFDNIN
ncbi:MAG: glycosyltransferase [Ruminococcaceae bacterium]|nr:glycosyltransferase [Oscillospiraceae bacterium]